RSARPRPTPTRCCSWIAAPAMTRTTASWCSARPTRSLRTRCSGATSARCCTMPTSDPTWAEFVEGWELFRDPVLCAAIAGVALAFYAGIHLGMDISPSLSAVLVSLAVAALLVPDPIRIGLSREAVLGLMFAATASAAVLVGSRITQEAHDIQAILFGTGVLV